MQKIINKIKNLKTKIQQSKLARGFTLVEVMVAVSIFSVVMVIAVGAVLAIVSANHKAQALNSVITNLNFAVEGMMRDIRTGYNYDCGTPDDGYVDCPSGASGDDTQMNFYSSQYNTNVVYGLVKNSPSNPCNNGIEKIVGGAVSCITSQEITIDALHFYVTDATSASSGGNYGQPRILIILQGRFNGFGGITNFNLQTMVSQRKLDI